LGSQCDPMVEKYAMLFPGQGSQYPGMGKSLYEKYPEAQAIFDSANEILGFDLKNKIFNGTQEELRETTVTQPAIFTVSCAIFNVFTSIHPNWKENCAFVAGHSLGEYSAFFSAGAFDFKTGLKLVQYRSCAIQKGCQKNPGSMAAILNMGRKELQLICDNCSKNGERCEMVNFNSPDQIVIAGSKKGIESALELIKGIPGKRAIPLNVSGPFHSTYLNEAAEAMAVELSNASIQKTVIPVFTNCDAKPTQEVNQIKENLGRQIDHPVLWEDSVQRMISEGVEKFIEIGPGKVLSGLLRKIDRSKSCIPIEDNFETGFRLSPE